MSVERPMKALIDLVRADRDAQCNALAQEAAARSAEILAQARHAARQRTQATLADERRRRSQLLAAAAARLANEERQHQQQTHARLLALAWQRLPDVLAQRWSQPAARADWLRHVFAAARAGLAPGAWTVVHGTALGADDRRLLADRAAAAGVALDFSADPAMGAGIKLRAGGNVVDGTADGLLADRAAIGSRLLELLQETS